MVVRVGRTSTVLVDVGKVFRGRGHPALGDGRDELSVELTSRASSRGGHYAPVCVSLGFPSWYACRSHRCSSSSTSSGPRTATTDPIFRSDTWSTFTTRGEGRA